MKVVIEFKQFDLGYGPQSVSLKVLDRLGELPTGRILRDKEGVSRLVGDYCSIEGWDDDDDGVEIAEYSDDLRDMLNGQLLATVDDK